MSDTNAHRWLNMAQQATDPTDQIAAALTGILAGLVDATDREDREDSLIRLHDRADAALARVLALADNLDAHPRATLKPTAFADLAGRIRDAVDGA